MTTNFLPEDEARAEICRVGASLFARGYVHATAGNISVRLANGFLITPTDACLGQLVPEDLALLDLQGQQISGARASKTITLHRRIYEASASTAQPAHCVIHTHSTHTVACSLQGEANAELLPPITPYFVMKVGRVPHIAYHRPGAAEAAELVAQAITQYAAEGRPIRAVMLARLGPNVWHTSPAQAMATLEELEETAHLWLLGAGRTSALSEAQIDDLRHTFAASW
jgi:ribulose-5-phosphate 4-epimerase/fuculose-1-phosphate aldolase